MPSDSECNNSTSKPKAKAKGKAKILSAKDLREILSGRYYSSSIKSFRHYDEIIPGLFLGDMKTAKDIFGMEKLGITHILNAAYSASPFTDRECSQAYYEERNFPCDFLGVPAQDYPSFNIGFYFEETSNFIEKALKSGGKVLVHCQVGISRSATLVIAYLMMKHSMKMTAIEAVTYVGAIRPIFPNEGFLQQICELEYRLRHPKNILVRSLSTMSRRTFDKVFKKK